MSPLVTPGQDERVPCLRLVNRHPGRGPALILGLVPFVLLIFAYLVGSHVRLAANPDDKLLPTPSTLISTLHSYAAEEDVRSGQVLFWVDTVASLERILIALVLAASIGLAFGLAIGALPAVRAALAPFVAVVAMIPPLAVLPILFIVLGLGEVAKIALMTFGIAPCIVRDLSLRAAELPSEQLIKAQTLGASSWQLVTRVILPQMWPRLIDSLRLSMGSAWLFLIAAEAIASTEGLGYRIFLVRRYLAMDVILPYVAWITLLAFLMDWALKVLRSRAFPWTDMGR
jgi:NitT/TauT family transport system permease protein